MNRQYDYVIIGAGKAGLTAAQTLRELCPGATISLINGEDRLPYKRTNLTKHLSEDFGRNDFALLPPEAYAELNLDRIDGDPVVSIDPGEKTLECRSGLTLRWGRLLLATGALPHCLDIPGASLIRHLRSAGEAEEIRSLLKDRPLTVVIGQGVEGVELAEQCRLAGCRVILMGREERLMTRWLDPLLSQRMAELLDEKGIDCRYHLLPRSVRREGASYIIDCGEQEMQAGLVLSSLGIRGNPELAEELGIYGETGIVVDRHCRTALPDIYAAGDAAQSPAGWPRGLWHWAEYQGKTAAMNMAVRADSGEEGPELVNRPTRLKCEPFGNFYFSMALDTVRDSDCDRIYIKADKRYLRIYEKGGRSVAALMQGYGKAGGKLLEKGVREGMPPEKIAAALNALS